MSVGERSVLTSLKLSVARRLLGDSRGRRARVVVVERVGFEGPIAMTSRTDVDRGYEVSMRR